STRVGWNLRSLQADWTPCPGRPPSGPAKSRAGCFAQVLSVACRRTPTSPSAYGYRRDFASFMIYFAVPPSCPAFLSSAYSVHDAGRDGDGCDAHGTNGEKVGKRNRNGNGDVERWLGEDGRGKSITAFAPASRARPSCVFRRAFPGSETDWPS